MTLSYILRKSGGQRERVEKKSKKKNCTYTCQVTEQMAKSKYSTTGTEDSGLTLCVCVFPRMCTFMLLCKCALR